MYKTEFIIENKNHGYKLSNECFNYNDLLNVINILNTLNMVSFIP